MLEVQLMFKQRGLPLLLVVLLLGHLALPFADASSTSGRAGPDFRVVNMEFDLSLIHI